ncbi:MAG: hypothetical protein US96_C0037G0009 [Candidatus Woesebacteria bacterium GW2011_GWB1_38_5b]|uniref:Glycosyltransferase RgtA/B/C/D-like domain-containing protein n=1 Tax=Candidatus Woesebacteria bacterium GW2011_GWB1_38_5b TaxID=1618569 RepID=A0A0G0MKL2_9BACT|nr:MAG: hypothetical protein US96_C0037G0009 [Candidatus Woesebacteria bacterium GW2011_GWB1_38_5b]
MAEIKLIINNLKFKINNKELLTLGLILAVGALLRLYRISDYMTFLGDEGRDVIVVRRLLLFADPILVGPGTSIGNMYLGPIYYYFMAPWLWLANFNPVGPAIGVALLGILTIWFVWHVGKQFFGPIAGLVAAALYAVAHTIIIYSRSSWNPNIMPFFALLTMYCVWQIWQERKYKWMIVLGFAFAFVLQSHYLGLLLAPVIGLFWVLTFINSKKSGNTKYLILNTIYSTAAFALLMSPLVIFDARHDWRNFEAVKKFFLERQTTVSARPWNAIPNLLPILNKINSRLITAKQDDWGMWVTPLLLAPVIFIIGLTKKIKLASRQKNAYLLIFCWFGLALLGMGLYKQEIYDHYYGFFFAAPFLLIGGLAQSLINSSRIRGISLVVPVVFLLILINLLNSPLASPPAMQLKRTQDIALEIIKLSNNQPFNLAVIAERNYDDAYQYFIENAGAKLVDIDPQRADETITQQLFVVCEMEEAKCDPTHSPKAEVAGFGWSAIADQWRVSGTLVYKLVHTQ